MLLFFDGVGLLVPDYLAGKPTREDPSLAVPLQEKGLLHILEPETVLKRGDAETLATHLTDIIHAGLLDDLAKDGGEFHELSMSRLGYNADAGLGRMIFEELKARGLARESEDSYSIPMHHQVRNLVLVLLAQILQPKGPALGLNLLPATDRPQLVESLTELLSHPAAPSAGHVVSADLLTVGVDLSKVPLDEVLGFRGEHLREHRAYSTAVRSFVTEMSQLSEADRAKAMMERQKELEDLAADLRARHRSAWRKPASVVLGAAGAVWTVTTGDPFGALFAATSLLAGHERGNKAADQAGAFSFVFSAASRFP
jgi:hypothetical protein